MHMTVKHLENKQVRPIWASLRPHTNMSTITRREQSLLLLAEMQITSQVKWGHLISHKLEQFQKQNTQGVSHWNVFVNTNATARQYYENNSQPFWLWVNPQWESCLKTFQSSFISKQLKWVKIELSFSSLFSRPWWHTGGAEVQLHSFLTSALDGVDRLTSSSSCFTPRKEP